MNENTRGKRGTEKGEKMNNSNFMTSKVSWNFHGFGRRGRLRSKNRVLNWSRTDESGNAPVKIFVNFDRLIEARRMINADKNSFFFNQKITE